MKKAVIILFLAVPGMVLAQKEIKPNPNKALNSLKAKKYDEAKANIDAATTYEKTMNDGKTWFYRGVIYGALDTTSTYTSTENLTAVAAESFKKATELGGGKAGAYYISNDQGLPVLFDQVQGNIANAYLSKGDKLFGAEKYPEALVQFEKGLTFKADTIFYQYAGYAAFNAEDRKKTSEYLGKYIEMGGRNAQAVTMPALIAYEDQNYESALTYSREVLKFNPDHKDMKVVELNSLIQLKKYDDAASLLENSLKANPNDAQGLYLLGVLNSELKKFPESKKNFEDAQKVDPKHFESAIALARLYYQDAKVIKDEMNALGISAADKKKRFELDAKYLEKLKVALPFWEKAEKLNPSDQSVLDGLYTIYGDLDNQKELSRIEKRYKELGLE